MGQMQIIKLYFCICSVGGVGVKDMLMFYFCSLVMWLVKRLKTEHRTITLTRKTVGEFTEPRFHNQHCSYSGQSEWCVDYQETVMCNAVSIWMERCVKHGGPLKVTCLIHDEFTVHLIRQLAAVGFDASHKVRTGSKHLLHQYSQGMLDKTDYLTPL